VLIEERLELGTGWLIDDILGERCWKGRHLQSISGALPTRKVRLIGRSVRCRRSCDRQASRPVAFYIDRSANLTQTLGWTGAFTSEPSAYAVLAASSADVAAAVNFAREHRVRLVVKGGGHSYLGTSNAPDSLLIWTRPNMAAVEVLDSFVPQGAAGAAEPEPTVSVGAGAIWMDAYNAVTTVAGRYVQGGGCTTVGWAA
jgi:FAD/FMN-containing dehydrogenase